MLLTSSAVELVHQHLIQPLSCKLCMLHAFVHACCPTQQVEGAAQADNRSSSVWDVFQQKPGAIAGGATANVAADFYNR